MSFNLFIKAESLCLSEFYHYTMRHRRYFTIFLFLYLPAPFKFRKMQLLRYGFCLLQYIDDLLDGDRKTNLDVNKVAKDAIDEIQAMQFSNSRAGVLAKAFFSIVKKEGMDIEQFKESIITLIKVMQFDYKRVNEKITLSVDELQKQHQETFNYSVDLMLMAAGSKLRAKQVPNLINTFGWCSTMRDLEEDYERGLYNIPKDIVDTSMSFNEVRTNSNFKKWIQSEFALADQYLDRSNQELKELKNEKGFKILMIFWKSMNSFFNKFKQRNRIYFNSI